jgi:hypothetical protein
MSKRGRFANSTPPNNANAPTLSEYELAMFRRADRAKVDKAVQSGLIQVDEQGHWYFEDYRIAPTGLHIPENTTLESYEAFGRFILDVGSRIQWLIGDWIAYGDQFQWGETYSQIADEFGYEVKTLYDYAYVCSNVQFSVRTEKLSFGHHKLVAALDEDVQRQWLQQALVGEDGKRWSVARMRREMRGGSDTKAIAPPRSDWRDYTTYMRERIVEKWHKMSGNERREFQQELASLLHQIEELGFD